MKKYILLILPVLLFVFLVKVPSVSALTQEDCAKFSSTSFPPSSECMAVPCSNAYKWVLMPNPPNASRFGYTNGTAPNACAVDSDCPENKGDSANVDPRTSNWCYQFSDGTRCIQLQHIDGQTCPGGGGGGGTCTIGGQSPDMGSTCAACLSSKTSPTNVPQVITNIKNMNPNDFNACSNQKILNNWCNGFGAEAARQCNELKTGVCAISCGNLPNPSPGTSPSPGSGGNPGTSPSPATNVPPLSCNIGPSNVSSITRGSSATFTATTTDSRVKRINFFYALGGTSDVNIGTQWNVLANSRSVACRATAGGCSAEIPADSIPAGSDKILLTCNAFTADVDDPFAVDGTNPAARCTGNPLAIGKTPANPYISPSNQSYSDCGTGSRKEVAIVAAPIPTPTPTPTPPPPATFTTEYRIAEDPSDFADPNKGWQPYTAEPIRIDNFEFKTKTPGPKFIWVEFKDTTGKIERRSAQIKLLGPEPTVTFCSLGFEGNNTVLKLTGTNFGSVQGSIKSGEANLQIKQWKDDVIQAVWSNAPIGQILPISLTNSDGQSNPDGQYCGAISQLALGAKVFCRAPSNHQTDNVDLTLVEAFEEGKKIKQKVSIDKEGLIQGLTQRLEIGKDYVLSLKAPRSLRRVAPFRAGDGINNIPNFILPVGDVFPAEGGDGKINNFDRQELVRQWSITKDATGRSGDFNRDGRVNSIDWTCMKYDFGQEDSPEPNPGIQSAPPPCAPGVVAGTAGCVIAPSSPSPSVSPSPSASPGT